MENSLPIAHTAVPENRWQIMAEFTLDSRLGSEVLSAESVAQRLVLLHLPVPQMERLTQAVANAVLNVIKHNPSHQSEPLVQIQVMAPGWWRAYAEPSSSSDARFDATATSLQQDGSAPLSDGQPAGCWGFFLVERSVDLKQVDTNGVQHTIDLFLYQEATGAYA